jgi:hypothetical protein
MPRRRWSRRPELEIFNLAGGGLIGRWRQPRRMDTMSSVINAILDQNLARTSYKYSVRVHLLIMPITLRVNQRVDVWTSLREKRVVKVEYDQNYNKPELNLAEIQMLNLSFNSK